MQDEVEERMEVAEEKGEGGGERRGVDSKKENSKAFIENFKNTEESAGILRRLVVT